ncbi:type II secretion protein F [Aeromicrobium sp. A1-2]|uniref:type II secretion system F family protein n=1 Tax=Aeromicrobium sp. A1-2 TaxID=2107713 RepID=UPI000E4B7BA4|nr:type II secretion system F family protein [Aeromicrobium sp. A1-2]AXT86202.1 type II secretion protein F [Aeromicrobium sp. A1-2]
MAAILAALAVSCLLPSGTRSRRRSLFGGQADRTGVDPALLAALIAPVAIVLILGMPLGPLLGIALAPVVHRSVSRLESGASRRRAARIAAQLPTALDLMVAALAVGRPPVTAFALAAEATADPLGTELGVVASRLAIAADPDAVWRGLTRDPSLAPVARAFRRAEASGMPVARIVSGVADELRRERRAGRREDSRKVAVRTAAPLGACFLPAFFLVGIVPTIIATLGSFSL